MVGSDFWEAPKCSRNAIKHAVKSDPGGTKDGASRIRFLGPGDKKKQDRQSDRLWSLQGPYKEPPGPLKQTLLDLQDHQNHLQDHQNHPQEHQNHLQDHQNPPNKQPPLGGLLTCMVLMVLEVILVFLGVVLVVLEVILVVLKV